MFYYIIMKDRTTIQVEQTTVERLKKIKVARRESYDEIINRLINFLEQEEDENE